MPRLVLTVANFDPCLELRGSRYCVTVASAGRRNGCAVFAAQLAIPCHPYCGIQSVPSLLPQKAMNSLKSEPTVLRPRSRVYESGTSMGCRSSQSAYHLGLTYRILLTFVSPQRASRETRRFAISKMFFSYSCVSRFEVFEHLCHFRSRTAGWRLQCDDKKPQDAYEKHVSAVWVGLLPYEGAPTEARRDLEIPDGDKAC